MTANKRKRRKSNILFVDIARADFRIFTSRALHTVESTREITLIAQKTEMEMQLLMDATQIPNSASNQNKKPLKKNSQLIPNPTREKRKPAG